VPTITVFCVCVGDKYHAGYVYALKESVNKYLSVDHEFKCITEHDIPGIQTIKPPLPYQGWWSKLGLFYPGVATGRSLYFDLDVVITGSLDYLVDFSEHEFSAPANWAKSGHGGIQSSVMAWRGNWSAPYDYIKTQWPEVSKRLWGDQELLWEMLGDNWVRIPGIYSYKYHCRNDSRPDDMSVCVFHGDPKPIEVLDIWLLPYTSTLRKGIRWNMGNGSKKESKGTALR
jgi:hypothetical protein